MFWQLASFPTCQFHVFLSHCEEDRVSLVEPVYESLSADKIRSFLAKEDHYYGRDSRTALRDSILDSRHIVFFITDAMLTSARGWCVLELVLAELIEADLHYRGRKLTNAILPLFLISKPDIRLPKTVWQLLAERGPFLEPESNVDRV